VIVSSQMGDGSVKRKHTTVRSDVLLIFFV